MIAWLRTRRALTEDVHSLEALLEVEREQHLKHVLDAIEILGGRAVHFGNVGPRVYPEQLEQFRDLAAKQGARILIVSGSGHVHGVYPTIPASPVACPSCPHPRSSHGPFGCTSVFCGCERTWIGGGWP